MAVRGSRHRSTEHSYYLDLGTEGEVQYGPAHSCLLPTSASANSIRIRSAVDYCGQLFSSNNFGDATGLTIEGCTPSPSGQEVAASYRVVAQNDFRTMSIPLVVRLLARR